MRFTFLSTLFSALFIVLRAATPALAQVDSLGSLEGRVVDATTQQPVVGAIISFESIKDGPPRQQQKIGPTGAFRFTLLPGNGYHVQSEYYIRTEAAGYIPTKEKFITTSGHAIYTNRISGKTIYLTKGIAPKSSPAQTALLTAPVPLTAAQTKPLAATPAAARTAIPAPAAQSPLVSVITTASPSLTVRTNPAITTAASVSARLAPVPAPPPSVSATVRSRPVVPAPPVTASAVQTQLRAVQFVQSKAELIPDSQPALDQLLTFMQENPKVTIELAGHTDNQGNFEENLALSRQRVELVKTFLVQHGITANRINSRGYGSTRPIASNNAEATRRLNRRVEMTILTK